jgi:NTE family protein
MKKLAIALGGGGARGLAHVGVLRILEKEKIPIARIAGCSMGAMVGGAYALYQNADAVEELTYHFIEHPVFEGFNFDDFAAIDKSGKDLKSKAISAMGRIKVGLSLFKTLAKPSIYDVELAEKAYHNYPDHLIEELPLRFSAITSDLLTGEEVLLKKGSLRLAIRASSSIPGYLPPVKWGKYLLVDGGVSNLVPTQYFRKSENELIIGVDVSRSIKDRVDLKSGVDIMQRAENIRNYHLTKLKVSNADKVISCRMGDISWADFKQTANIIKAGEKAARRLLPWLEKHLD